MSHARASPRAVSEASLDTRRSEAATATLPFNRGIYLFYASGLVVVGGGFVLYTSGADLSVAGDATAGSLISQSILGSYYLLAFLLLVSGRNFASVVKSSWPVLILPCLAVASAGWSPDPALTLRRAFAFGGTALFGLSLASAYQYRDCAVLICKALIAAMVLSMAAVLFDPRYGMHQLYDAVQAVHAGSWRGIFAHRNTLGLWSGATLAFLVVVGRDALGLINWAVGIAAAMACLFYSGSSAGIVIAALVLVGHLTLISIVRQPPSLRWPAFFVSIALAFSIAIFWDDLTRVVLELLGRQSDLSGRTLIWYYIIQAAQTFERPFGLGYFVGTLLLDQRLSSIGEIKFVNAHNGYIEAFVYFGIAGVIIAMGVVLFIFIRTVRYLNVVRDYTGEIRTVPALIIWMVAIHNMVESTMVSPNNLNTLLMATAAGMVAMPGRSTRVGS